jgi:FKBP12-rapamycin complex-associated protein
MARELFASAFASCWAELGETAHEELSERFESALGGATTPPAIVATLLNLAEFMEHDEHPLPLDARTLGGHASRCHAFAKALRYKEQEFAADPAGCVEALISINNALGQPDAAAGSLVIAQSKLKLAIKEEWYEALGRWESALESYVKRATLAPPGSGARHAAQLGRMRCLAALAEWNALGEAAATAWTAQPEAHAEIAPVAAQAAWHLGDWDSLERYVQPLPTGVERQRASMSDGTSFLGFGGASSTALGFDPPQYTGNARDLVQLTTDGDLYRAVLALRRGDLLGSRQHVEAAREVLATELAALVGESYERAYSGLVCVQQLTELEEVITLYETTRSASSGAALISPAAALSATIGADDLGALAASSAAATAAHLGALRAVWRRRLGCVKRSADVWQALLSVRRLVFPPDGGDPEDIPVWAEFASLQRKAGAPRAARRTLLRMLGVEPSTAPPGVAALPGKGSGGRPPEAVLAFLKHLWATGHRSDALQRLNEVVDELRGPAAAAAAAAAMAAATAAASGPAGVWAGALPLSSSGALPGGVSSAGCYTPAEKLAPMHVGQLYARASLRVAQWRWTSAGVQLDEGTINNVLASLRAATDADPGWSKAWHMWGLFNAAAMEHYARTSPSAAARHVAPAVRGFFRSIALGTAKGGTHLQDILRLLTLWFSHGAAPDVEAALQEGFAQVSIDTWLAVIPQIVARIHSSIPPVRQLIHALLVRVGRHHPQALLYPVLVASKSQSPARRAAANGVLDALRVSAGTLVAQAQLVSEELIRVAITWHEQWHEALEEASRLYFGESNVDAMMAVLAPLHAQLERGDAETLQEGAFVAAYGRELGEAAEWCSRYRNTGREADLNNAWDLYYHVFKRINKQLPTMTQLELQHVSPRLVGARHLELAVPGNYLIGVPVVTIASFAPTLHVITSKQRPRKLSVLGSDGKVYGYLLKGHEDLRQDERVMQLFGLVNTLLAQDGHTAGRDLDIARYAVVPLSPNSGLLGWVPNCDTFHALIREHREAHKVPLNLEHRIMLAMAPDYDQLPLINKVEVFEHALSNTSGDDIARVLWLRSRSSEVWLDRRTAYTRSLAVMSMVGYLLGLGDRHPSNLMLDRYSGKVLHIDFGDCFEASQHRDKFPEKVPFRLTRMLVNAMEACGIEGNFRHTAELVMAVLRNNKDSVMAMLEAFVHDPLINWRLLHTTDAGALAAQAAQPTTPLPPPPPAQPAAAEAAPPPPSGGTPAAVTPPPSQVPALPPLPPTVESQVGVPPLPGGRRTPGPPGARRSSMNAAALMEHTQAAAAAAAGEGVQTGGAVRPVPTRRASFNTLALLEEQQPGAGAAVVATTPPQQKQPQLSASRPSSRRPSDPSAEVDAPTATQVAPSSTAAVGAPGVASPPVQRAARERELKDVFFALGDANEVLNERAVSVMRRMAAKLTGRDGASAAGTAPGGVPGAPSGSAVATAAAVADGPPDSVEAQVQRLIIEAMSHENLCQSYIGWCPFW